MEGSWEDCNSLPPGGWREAGKDEETLPHREGRDPHSGRGALGHSRELAEPSGVGKGGIQHTTPARATNSPRGGRKAGPDMLPSLGQR